MTDICFVNMKLLSNILKSIVLILTVLLVLLFSASLLMQDKVADIILMSLNKNLSVKVDIGSFRLSLLRKFPKASLELNDVLVHSSHDFDSRSFTGINTDTLLSAKLVSVEFKMTDILRGKYNIEKVSAREGVLNLYSDMGGFVNYKISASKETSDNDTFAINLERISLNDIKANYKNLGVKLYISGLIKEGKIKSKISRRDIDFIADGELVMDRFQLNSTTIDKPVITGFDLDLHSSENGILFKKSILKTDNNEFEINGFVASDNQVDLNIKGNKIDVSGLLTYLPERYFRYFSEYKPSGFLTAECKIKGPVTKTKNPHLEITYILKNGQLTHVKSKTSLKNISFSGMITNGLKNNSESGLLSLKDISFSLGQSEFKGSVILSEFRHPKTTIALKGKAFPLLIKDFFDIESIAAVSGSVDLDLNFSTGFWPKEKTTFDDVIALKPRGTLDFNSFSIRFTDYKFAVNDVNGNITLGDHMKARNLSFIYKAQPVKLDGDFSNLPEWLSGRKVLMTVNADISFKRFIPEAFMDDPTPEGKKAGRPSFTMPENLSFNVNFNIDSLTYKTFSSSAIKGSATYKSNLLTFKALDMKSLNGMISGNGFIVRNANKTVLARGSFNLNGIDVNKAFKTFKNFGQDFIKAENLSGSLSGSLSVLIPMDSILNPQIKSLTAEGKYILSDGALINFEPIKQLSSFIEISELENINFDKLENDFSIRNNFLFIPQMDVKSSAADISVNGKHSFGNDYEYHVKVLLSEILSKKRKKNRNKITEFGLVEDDGLGRTSLLLIVGNKGDEVEVGYDIKAAGNQVKENIKSEKQSIKAILNEEYGWYKNDSVPEKKPPEKKPRVKVTWDDSP